MTQTQTTTASQATNAAAVGGQDIKVPIRTFMSQSFDGQTFADGDDVFALGFGNSLFAMQLVTFVEEEFDIEIEAEDLDMANFSTIDAISGLVQRKLGPA